MRKKTVLFHRDFAGFTGGHLKVWDYYQHIQSSKNYNAEIFFTRKSSWVDNPWLGVRNKCLDNWNPEKTDILFLAGMDWLALSESERQSPPAPVINLIQHVRHADSNNPLYEFLKYPATRICVSQQVAEAIDATGEVNGDIVVNTNGIDHALLPRPLSLENKDIPLLIMGLKNPELAQSLSGELSANGIKHTLILKHLPRYEFLSLINRSLVTVLLPTLTEGFYLPALEAMYLDTLVICPDCIGNRSFCKDAITCIRPAYNFKNIIKAIQQALAMSSEKRMEITSVAKNLALEHTIEQERNNFLELLSAVC